MVRGQTPHEGARTRRDLRPAVEPMRGGALERDGDVRVWGVGGEALKLGPEHDPRVSTLHANALDVGLARDHEVEKEARVDLGAQRGGHVEVGEHRLQALDAPGMHLLDDVPDVEEVAQTAGGRGVATARHVGWGVGLGGGEQVVMILIKNPRESIYAAHGFTIRISQFLLKTKSQQSLYV